MTGVDQLVKNESLLSLQQFATFSRLHGSRNPQFFKSILSPRKSVTSRIAQSPFMGTIQKASGVHRTLPSRLARSRIVASGGRLRAHHRQRFNTTTRHRAIDERRASAVQVNTYMPRRPSLAFRSQNVRRKVWMLEAKKAGLHLGRARELSSMLSKLKKKVKYMNRQQHRSDFKDSLRRVFKGKCITCPNTMSQSCILPILSHRCVS